MNNEGEEGVEEGVEENEENVLEGNKGNEEEMSPEELEAFAKKTANRAYALFAVKVYISLYLRQKLSE